MATPYVGQITIFGGNFPPVGYVLCNGQSLNISEFSTLFTVIGTTYGGDGQTTFNVPDLRGRVPLHFGNGPGLTSRPIGQAAGTEVVTLTVPQIPSHNHSAMATTANASTITAGSSVTYGAVQTNANAGLLGMYTTLAPPAVTAAQMNSAAVRNSGGGQPHDNTMPTLVLNYIIATDGVFPSQA